MYTAHTYAYRMSGFCPYNAVCSITPSIRNIRNCNIRKHTAVMGKSCTPACSAVIKARHRHPQLFTFTFTFTTMMRRLSAVIMTRYGHLKLIMTISTLVMTTLVTHESSHKDSHSRHTCLHPYTICHAHTALSNVRVFGHDAILSLDNICLFVHDVEPPCWFTRHACGCRGGPCWQT